MIVYDNNRDYILPQKLLTQQLLSMFKTKNGKNFVWEWNQINLKEPPASHPYLLQSRAE